MTTTAPERIWAEHDNDPERQEVEAIGYNRPLPYTTEYTRTDIADARVAAAYVDAADKVARRFKSRNTVYAKARQDAAADLLDECPQDARAAYDKAIAEAVAAERERCAEIADGYHAWAIEWAKKVRGIAEHIDQTDSSRIAADIRDVRE